METLMELFSLRLSCWPLFPKGQTLKLAGVIAAAFFYCVFTGYCLAADSSMRTAENWEDIANIRTQIAKDYETESETVLKGDGANSLDTGDLLDLSGDEKFLAAENYQLASQQWDKAAKAYISAGATAQAKKARENADIALAAAKRALSDGVYVHMKAKEQYQATNSLDKKTNALQKAARNLERLMEMK